MDPPPPAIRTGETVETDKSPWVLAAVFILVEIVLMAETISVMLLGGSEQRNPGATPIALLLSTALLANLGLVCSFIAASAASAVRRSRCAEAASFSAEVAESPDDYPSAVDVLGSAANPGTAASSSMPANG
jgi:Zn-dependent protease with chaperone function